MMRFALVVLLISCCSVAKGQASDEYVKDETLFSKAKDKGQIEARLNEASGLVASFLNPNCFWVLNDSGNPAEVFLINSTAKTRLVCKLQGIKNRDWEDIAIGSGPKKQKKYLYVAEIGDNNAKYDFKYLYRFEEPQLSQGPEQTITNVETLVVKMPDGNRDTETLMIDPLNNDLFIISKREEKVRVYLQKFPYPSDTLRPIKVLELPFNWVTAGAISLDGREVLIKNYSKVYYWKRTNEKSIVELLPKPPIELTYDPEPQGESICFAINNTGYYTISETRDGAPMAQLKFYRRLK